MSLVFYNKENVITDIFARINQQLPNLLKVVDDKKMMLDFQEFYDR